MELKIAVWANDLTAVSAVTGWLQKWTGAQGDVLHWTRAEQMNDALSQETNTRYLVLFDTAAHAIAQATNPRPSDSLPRWSDDATALLSAYRRGRRKMLIVSPYRMAMAPDATQAALATHLDIAAPAHSTAKALLPAIAHWEHLVALQAVAQDPAAQRLAGDLDAAMVPIADMPVDPDAAYAEITGKDAAVHSLQKSAEKAAKAQSQKDISQAAQTRSLETALATSTTQLEGLRASYAKLQEQEAGVQAERGFLLSQLEGVQAEFQTHFTTAMTAQKELATTRDILAAHEADAQARDQNLEAAHNDIGLLAQALNSVRSDLDHRDGEVGALLASTSWRFTAPMRRISRAFGGTGRKKDA